VADSRQPPPASAPAASDSPKAVQTPVPPSTVGERCTPVALRQWGPAAGVWESLRVLHYDAEDFFLPHRDQACEIGHSRFLPECRSFYSLLIYLADSEDGSAATRFFCEPASTDGAGINSDRARMNADGTVVVLAEAGDARLAACECEVVADVVPWSGRCVVFPHRMLHASLPVVQGHKHVVRGDVLYGIAASADTPASRAGPEQLPCSTRSSHTL